MASSGGMALADTGVGVEDYNFTDDFDMGDAEYGVDENVLDLSEAEAEGFGPATSSVPASADDFDSAGMGGMASFEDDAGPDDFELDLSESTASQASVEPEAEAAVPDISPDSEADVSPDISPGAEDTAEADTAVDADFTGSGFDSEVEGLGFGFDESPAEEAPEAEAATEEISLDAAPEPEAEISLEPELELPADEPADEGPSLELPEEEPSIEMTEEEPSLELSDEPADEEPSIEMPEEEPSLELSDEPDESPSLELADEPELDMGGEEIELSDEAGLDAEDTGDYEEEEEDAGGIEFDLDSVDLDAPKEEVSMDEEPEAVDTGEEPSLEIEGLELEMESPEEPEEEDNLKQ